MTGQLEHLLKTAAEQELDLYITQQGWPTPTVDYQVWLSPSASHLPACSHEVRLQAGGQYRQPWGRRPYLVECTEPAWQLRARVEVSVILPVWVSGRAIPKGHTIGPADLVEKSIDVSQLQRGFIPANRSLLGYHSRRQLRMGQLVSELDLQPRWAVQEGEEVLIRAGQQGFAATTRGVALQNGAIGDGIRVRNSSSGQTIQTWIIASGEVETRF